MRLVVASATFTREMTGVIPLPPANRTRSPAPGVRRNTPAGQVASISSPTASVSFIQLDTSPSGTRLTVTWSSSSTPGAEHIE